MKQKIKSGFSCIKRKVYKLAIFFSIVAWAIPSIFNFSKVNVVGKILILLGFVVGLALMIRGLFHFDKKKSKSEKIKLILADTELTALYVIGGLKMISFDLWGKQSVIIGLNFVLLMFFEIYYFVKSLAGKRLEKEQFFCVLIALMTTFLFIAIGNEEADNHQYAELCLKICAGMVYLISTSIFVNAFLFKRSNKEKQLSNIIWFVLFGGIILISFPFYIKWCGVEGENLGHFVAVYSAFIGGAITLAGVAWTIKDNNENRKQDLQRVEDERKEEERKKYIPYISTVVEAEVFNYVCVAKNKWLNFKKTEDVAKINNNSYYAIKFENFYIKNLSNSNIIFEGIYIDDNYYKFDYEKLLEINGVLCVKFDNTNWYEFADKVSHIALQVADILGNHYKVSCEYSQRLHCQPKKDIAINGLEYMVYPYVYTVESLSLPKLLQDAT